MAEQLKQKLEQMKREKAERDGNKQQTNKNPRTEKEAEKPKGSSRSKKKEFSLKFGELNISYNQAQEILNKIYKLESMVPVISADKEIHLNQIIFQTIEKEYKNAPRNDIWKPVMNSFVGSKGIINTNTFFEWLKIYYTFIDLTSDDRMEIDLIRDATDEQISLLDQYLNKINLKHLYGILKETTNIEGGTTRTLYTLLKGGILPNFRFYDKDNLKLIMNPSKNSKRYSYASHFSKYFETITFCYEDLLLKLYELNGEFSKCDTEKITDNIKKEILNSISKTPEKTPNKNPIQELLDDDSDDDDFNEDEVDLSEFDDL